MEAIPALLHISVFLFLTGLVISLVNIHHTVGYVVLAACVACAAVYAAITVLPAIYHDSPYTSPFSAPVWYVSRKTSLVLFRTVDHIADFVKKHRGLGETHSTLPLSGKALPGKAHPFRKMTMDAYDAAMNSDKGMIARALGWTLDKMDEEGELVKFAAGIPGFSYSTEVKDAVSILEEVPKCSESHSGLYRHITNLLIRSARPGLLPDSKLLPESVRNERITICLEALYFLPDAIKNILRHAADKKDNKTVTNALSPILQSVESWRVAKRLSKSNYGVHPDVTIAAQCVSAVLASQSPDEQTESIVLQLLKIKIEEYRDDYMSQPHNLRLRNLNRFVEKTALKYIEKDPEKYSIVVSAVCLAKKELNFEDAWLKLREKCKTLLATIASLMTGSSSENARRNAIELYSELTKSLHDQDSSAQSAQAGPSSAPPPDDDDDDDDNNAERATSSQRRPFALLKHPSCNILVTQILRWSLPRQIATL